MSKWKHKTVTIIQAFHGKYYGDCFGLGGDQKLYRWDRGHGAWEKFWDEQDSPNV